MTSLFRFVATCVPGAEMRVAKELTNLGVAVVSTPGAVQGRASLGDVRRILTSARIVESVRVRPTRAFKALSFDALCEGASKVQWHAYLVAGLPLEVRVTCSKSRLYHSDAVAERIRRVIDDRTKRVWHAPDEVSINAHCNRVYVRLDHDEVEVGFDAAGEALHRRGYRTHVQEAPIRETLAALLLELAAEVSPGSPISRLWDPCCGSGTIPLEWLAREFHLLPVRRFIMDEWPCFTESVPPAASPPELPSLPVAWGCDISARAVDAAEANAHNLGVQAGCVFTCSDFADFAKEVPSHSAVVTNLPYGVRLDTQNEVARLFQRLDNLLLRRKDLRPAVVLWGGGKQPPQLRGNWQAALRFKNGGLPVTAFVLR